MYRRVLTSLTVVTAFSALLSISPPAVHAIPSAGDYVFSESLNGTFHSTGSSMDVWSFTDPNGTLWSNTNPTQVEHINDADVFFAIRPNTLFVGGTSINFDWNFFPLGVDHGIVEGLVIEPGFLFGQNIIAVFSRAPVPTVPEPSTAMLLLAGLVLLSGYGWPLRQAGQQVG